jgi:hypothetical protein
MVNLLFKLAFLSFFLTISSQLPRMRTPEKAKPAARRGRKALGLHKEIEIAGPPGKGARFFFFGGRDYDQANFSDD